MRYHDIEKDSMLNGDGIRTVLWLSGCNHHCHGCQNPTTWDPDDGLLFDEDAEQELYSYIDADYCSGLTLSGGDPMYPGNRKAILAICKLFRRKFEDKKTIWMYTGYEFSEIKDDPILDYVDVVVDGPYVEEQRNINRQWVGSENQRVWRKTDGQWIMEEPKYAETIEPGKNMPDVHLE